MKRNAYLLAILCAAMWCCPVWADEPPADEEKESKSSAELAVGSKAPSLSIDKWVKGSEVDLAKAKSDEVYVVEFWATWCPPCRTSIPHLSQLQKHFKPKGVTFIGISNEKTDVVKKFLDNGWNDKMQYTVAIDKKNKTSEDWMEASGQDGIPTAFVVKGGKIKWIGHPMMGLDVEVAEACGDKEYAAKAKEFKKLGDELGAAIKDDEIDDAIKLIDKMVALRPDESRLGMTKYMLLATKKKDKEAAIKAGTAFVNQTDDAQSLNQIAWTMLTEDEFEDVRDIKFATMAAKKAMDVTKEKDPAIMDTYARALADGGDIKGAIEWQKKAIALCGDDEKYEEMKAELEKTLKGYETR